MALAEGRKRKANAALIPDRAVLDPLHTWLLMKMAVAVPTRVAFGSLGPGDSGTPYVTVRESVVVARRPSPSGE